MGKIEMSLVYVSLIFINNIMASHHHSVALYSRTPAWARAWQWVWFQFAANEDRFYNRPKRRINGLFAVTLLSVFTVICSIQEVAAAGRVGEVKLAVGKVEAVSAQQESRVLKIGAEIFEGDVVKTDKKGFAVIIMDDKAKFTLKPNTTFEITQVSNDNNPSMLTNLVTGGMKVITGQIANKNPENFRINTPLGSIGVRGTRFDIWLCLSDADCELEYSLFNDAIKDLERNDRLLFVHVTEGETVFYDCEGTPTVSPDNLGWSNGAVDGCTVIPLPPSLTLDSFTKGSEALDESLTTLNAPLLQQLEVGDVLDLCGGDPVCIQCKGDPVCMQCNGDPVCYDCQSDPLCAQCNGDAICVACKGDALCQACSGDPLCIQCDGNSACIACNNDPLCLCQGDTSCECDINPALPACSIEELEEETSAPEEGEQVPPPCSEKALFQVPTSC